MVKPLVLALFITSLLGSQQEVRPQDPKNPKVDQDKVDRAIEQGVGYLKKAFEKTKEFESAGSHHRLGGDMRVHELVALTLLHAKLDEADPVLCKLIKTLLEKPLDKTYHVALQAMVFQQLDAVKYQARIAQCAQYLVDTQCRNGQWGYGEELKDNAPPTIDTSGSKALANGKDTKSMPKITIVKRRDGPDSGDNSNSQYAALGLRACFDSNIAVPAETIRKAKEWWERSQKDNAWTYNYQGKPNAYVGYGSMTAGAIGALCIYDFILNLPFKTDAHVQNAVKWLSGNFEVKPDPKVDGKPTHNEEGRHYYYLYALERAGILYGTDKFGSHDWYFEGATYLIENQNADGSWTKGSHMNVIADTCFAILFLRRATLPLIKTGTGK